MALDIIIQILIILAVSMVIGEIFEQLKFPSIVGYLIAGLIIGPFFLDVISINSSLQTLSSLALFFIIFLLGIEMKTEYVIKYLKPGIKMVIPSFVLPLILAIALSTTLFSFGIKADLIVSLSIAVPSISIISVLIMKYRLERDSKGVTIISSVIITDTLAFILLGMTYKNFLDAILMIVYFTVFLLIFVNIDKVLNKGKKKFRMHLTRSRAILKSEHFGYGVIIIIGLLVGVISQLIGINYIIGVFFAGLIIHEGLIGRKLFGKIRKTLKRMNDGFFIPIFFGIAGIEVSSFQIIKNIVIQIVIISFAVIFFSLILNFYFSGRVMRIKNKKVKRKVSAIINGRGAVGIAIATVGLSIGVITEQAYSVAILATIIISIIATSFLRGS
ncbi:MAG: sodium/hydrogen exchanger [Candidatus Parvarchaeum acidophilus ARMAN-5]|jgi:Kef-type K+ transport system membrane component KefB|uniref:Sodium/hydrogen exchanger n=1 Tax=Candidatus Parvarchaeum acidophilus ARMAN-5 TaxID=662762 RepID=D6GUV2_PARA5|nr:MAG: sodium/hydrogen exchanger [Candidatus Parvarchaeum acidophilus ARMAN-5]